MTKTAKEPMCGRDLISRYCEGKMSSRPEFYSGRGATISDLNSNLLEMVYKGVKEEMGDEAAEHFVVFIANFDKLSATAFLNEFYCWYANGCQLEKGKKLTNQDHRDVGPDNGGRFATGLGTIAGAMFGDDRRDDTNAIRYGFLQRHKDIRAKHKSKVKNIDGILCNNGYVVHFR